MESTCPKPILLAILFLLVVGCSNKELRESFTSDASSICSGLGVEECEVFNLINQQRTSRGIPQLKVLSNCQQLAKDHAVDMVTRGFFSHDSPTETFSQRVGRYQLSGGWVGENIAMNSDGASAVNQWMNSTGHRNNILNSNYRSTGVGYYQNHWVQCFSSFEGDK